MHGTFPRRSVRHTNRGYERHGNELTASADARMASVGNPGDTSSLVAGSSIGAEKVEGRHDRSHAGRGVFGGRTNEKDS